MDKDAWLELINLKEELIPAGRHNRPGLPLAPNRITIHNTDNPDQGADANRHSLFVRTNGYQEYGGRKKSVSWHYTVDDRVAIRQLPDHERGYHAGSEIGNGTSIGIEICMQQGIDQAAANRRAAQLAAYLVVQHRLLPDVVLQHRHWTGKPCPSQLLDEAAWASFRRLVAGYVEHLRPSGNKHDDPVPLPAPFVFRGAMCWDDEQP